MLYAFRSSVMITYNFLHCRSPCQLLLLLALQSILLLGSDQPISAVVVAVAAALERGLQVVLQRQGLIPLIIQSIIQ